MRVLILAYVAASLALACGSGPKDDGSAKNAPAQANLSITTTGNGLVRGAGTDCRGSCRAQIAVGSPVHLIAVPDSGAFFVGWAGSCSGPGACDLTLEVDRDVSATFANTPPPPPPGKHQLVVVVQGKGRVTSSPAGLDCDSSTCIAQFDSGSSVTLTAAPASGFSFSGWGNDCSGPSACMLTLSKEATVFANFVAQPPAQVHLTASISGPGTVTGGGLNCGESAATCDVMVSGGSTVTLTASPASATRFMRWGGACSGTSTSCELTLQSDAKVTAEFQSEVIALAPNDSTNSAVIALNSTRVFWLRSTGGTSGIWSVGKNGGDAVKVADGFATAIVSDDLFLYWSDGWTLYSTPVGGGERTVLSTSGPIGKLALDELGALYWSVGASRGVFGPTPGSVHRMENRADTVLATGPSPNGEVAVDATHVYFTDRGSPQGSIRRVPRKGGSVETVFTCPVNCLPQALRVDPRFVYFRVGTGQPDTSGHVQAWSKADGTIRVLSRPNGEGGYSPLPDVEANASVVYWNWTAGKGPFGIFRANADGTGFAAVDSSNDMNWYAVKVDDVAVYYHHSGAIIRRLR